MSDIKKLLIVFYFVIISQLLTGCIITFGDIYETLDAAINPEEEEISISPSVFPEADELTEEEESVDYEVLPYFKKEALCYVGEVYNEQDDICTLPVTCKSNVACARWGDQVIRELETTYSGFSESYGVYTYSEEEEGYPYVEDDYFKEHFDSAWAKELLRILESKDDYDEKVVAAFPLDDDYNLVFPYEEYEDDYYGEWYWDEFKWIIPSEQLWMLDSFSLFIDDKLLAYVVDVEHDLSKWHLAINMNTDISYRDSIDTHIHEFAHLLFINSTQVDSNKICLKTFYIKDKGCTNNDSYTNQFAEQFGKKYDGEYDTDKFISEYAATGLVEDMAETFSMFVLTSKPEGNSIKEQKILFYYQYDELVLLRAHILSRVATYMYRYIYY